MIRSRQDLRLYLEADRISMCRGKFGLSSFLFDRVWKWERLLRKVEYYENRGGGLVFKLVKWFHWIRLLRMRVGVEIFTNCVGPGLCLVHGGPVFINKRARIGRNAVIHPMVVIGQGRSEDDVPTIGNNVHIGPGAKIIGSVVIGDNVVIAANAVVTRSFPEGNCTIGGIPAKRISDHISIRPYENGGDPLVRMAWEEAVARLKG